MRLQLVSSNGLVSFDQFDEALKMFKCNLTKNEMALIKRQFSVFNMIDF